MIMICTKKKRENNMSLSRDVLKIELVIEPVMTLDHCFIGRIVGSLVELHD
jgi:hypothetical protein